MSIICQWLLHRQKAFHYVLLSLSFAMLLLSLGIIHGLGSTYFLLLEIVTITLLLACAGFMWAWKQYCRCEQYCKHIRYEYNRITGKQTYKLQRLSAMESEILEQVVQNNSPEEIAAHMKLRYPSLYTQIGSIRKKLGITGNAALFDIDWSDII
jgi:DNA-binding CsgD family transcriptional regulator